MPHIIIEYSKSLETKTEISQLMEKSFAAAVESKLFSPERIKVRAKPYEHFLVGGTPKDFVHTRVYLLDGRNEEQKKMLSDLIGQAQKPLIDVESQTVDVRDMERSWYFK